MKDLLPFQEIISSAAWIISYRTIPLVLYLVNTDGGKKIIPQTNSGGDLTFVKLDLRDDGSFKLINSGPFGGKFYRGYYTLQNDTLRIDNGTKIFTPLLRLLSGLTQ